MRRSLASKMSGAGRQTARRNWPAGSWCLPLCGLPVLVGALALSGDLLRAADRVLLSVQSRLVLIPTTVTDRNGAHMQNLTAADFSVFDNSEPQEILSFAREEAPVSLALVMDLSGSMRGKMPYAVDAVRAITDIAEEDDEAFLLTFADLPTISVEPTRELRTIPQSLRFVEPEGATALIDAVYLALDKVRKTSNPRKAVVVISDGGDNHSRYSARDLKRRAVEADAQIYSISIHEQARSREERAGVYLLEDLAALTGGLHFTIRDRSELPQVAQKLAEAMKNVYVIGYKPSETAIPGKWRKVRVELSSRNFKSARVTARTGYFPSE